jgi:hypothetical protein
MGVYYNASYPGIGDMLTDEFMIEAMRVRGEAVLARAVSLSPVGKQNRDNERPRYIDSFDPVEAGIRQHGSRRAYARVSNHSNHALAVEYGTRNNPAHHVLVKALDAVAYAEGIARTSKNVPRARS